MSTHNMFSSRNKKHIDTLIFWLRKRLIWSYGPCPRFRIDEVFEHLIHALHPGGGGGVGDWGALTIKKDRGVLQEARPKLLPLSRHN